MFKFFSFSSFSQLGGMNGKCVWRWKESTSNSIWFPLRLAKKRKGIKRENKNVGKQKNRRMWKEKIENDKKEASQKTKVLEKKEKYDKSKYKIKIVLTNLQSCPLYCWENVAFSKIAPYRSQPLSIFNNDLHIFFCFLYMLLRSD